jgi:signal transduction histidine kinase
MDPARIRQLLWNLILNAAQATPEYGTIEISAQPDAVGRLVEIKVSDDGVGIPPEALRRIFDPFYTTRSGGTGLGLANVERVVRAHGGTIQVESVPNQGTTFTIRLPRKGPPDEPPEEGAHVRG